MATQADQMSEGTFIAISSMWLLSIVLMMVNIYQRSGEGDWWFMYAMIAVWLVIVGAIFAIYYAKTSGGMAASTARPLMATVAAVGAVIPICFALIVMSYSPGSIHRQSLLTTVLSFAGLGAFLYAV